jgi:carbonic anhydrase
MARTLLAAASALACGLALCATLPARADAGPPHWSYSGETGPSYWESEDAAYATCGIGKRQSPVDIENTVVTDLPALKFGYKATPLNVTDTGHTFQINAASGSGGLDVGGQHYDFVQVHFHEPSEEIVHGKRYAMVAHIVHKNAKGELAVVAVLIQVGKSNAFLKPIFDNFPAKGTVEDDVPGKTIDLGSFLPAHHGYYTFDGSLTTPPCSENVRWFVLKTPVEASEAQVQQFRARYTHDNRPTQPLNGRTIKESKSN